MKDKNIKKLRDNITKRNELLEKRNSLNLEIEEINSMIDGLFQLTGKKRIRFNGSRYQMVRSKRTIYDIPGLMKFLQIKIGNKLSKKVFKETTKVSVDDDILIELIQSKKVKIEQLRKFIQEIPNKPYLRVINAKTKRNE